MQRLKLPQYSADTAKGLSEPRPVASHDSKPQPTTTPPRPCAWLEQMRWPAFILSADESILACNRAAQTRFAFQFGQAPKPIRSVLRGWTEGTAHAALFETRPGPSDDEPRGVVCDLAGIGQALSVFRVRAWEHEAGVLLCLEPESAGIDLLEQGEGGEHNPLQWLANWLHDQPAQLLTAAKMRVHQLQSRTVDQDVHAELDAVQGLLGRAGLAVREAMAGLQPPGLFEPSLRAAVEETIRDAYAVYGIRCELLCRGDERGYRVASIDLVVRCLREGLINAVKHGGASRANLTLDCSADGLRFTLLDHGDAALAEKTLGQPSPGGYGLRWLRRRSLELGGDLSLRMTRRGGAELMLWLPDPDTERQARG